MSQPPQPPEPDPEERPALDGPLDVDATTRLHAAAPRDVERSAVDDSEHNPSLDGLGSRLRQGAKFAAFALAFTQLISLAQTVVVARLLSPLEIGTFTLGTLFASFLTTLSDGGMRAALIQREGEVEDAANTAFWVSLVTGTAMSLGALAAAPLLALFVDDRLVGLICAATCGTLLIHSLLNVPEALMQRRFNFKRRLVVDPTTASTYAVVAVTAVLLGFGVWGMVIGLYASQFATLIACWTLAKWRPGKGKFTFRIWREMAGYAGPLIFSELVDKARDAIQSALVGRRLDVASAGQYRYGRRIGILPGQAIIQVASYVLFPAFARIAGDVTRFKDGMLRSLRTLWVATTPFAAVLVALGQPMIVVLLGEQWRPAGLFVAAMAGYGPGIAMSAIGAESIKGAGASKRINWLTAISLVVGIGGLLLLIPYGLLGVGLAASAEGLVSGLASLAFARNLAGITIRDLTRLLVPPLVAAGVAGTAVGLLEHVVVHSDQRPLVLGLLFLALEGVLLLALFVGVLYLLAPSAVRELSAGLLRRVRRRRGGDGDGDADRGHGGPEGPQPDDRRAFLDAPTEVLPLVGIDNPTERVYAPYRRHPVPPPPRTAPAPPALPVATQATDARTAGSPVRWDEHAERARQFERHGVDPPTTALPPARPPDDGAMAGPSAVTAPRASNGMPNGSGNGSPDGAPTGAAQDGNGDAGAPPPPRPRRLVPLVRVSDHRRGAAPPEPESGGPGTAGGD